MSRKNSFIFRVLQVVAWIIFVGLSIEAGGLVVNFIFSIYNPGMVQHLYQKLDLSAMYTQSRWAFFGIYSFILVIAFYKAYMFYIVTVLVSRFDLAKPFSEFVADHIRKISYYTFFIGLISYIARQVAKTLTHHGYNVEDLDQFWADSQAFILMAAVIYIIATIFSKGVELQTENELTV